MLDTNILNATPVSGWAQGIVKATAYLDVHWLLNVLERMVHVPRDLDEVNLK